MNIRQIREEQQKLVDNARGLLDELTDNTPASRARELEAQHDRAMAEYDRLEERADGLKASERMPRDSETRSYRGESYRSKPVTDEQRKRAFNHYLRHGNAGLPDDLRDIATRMRNEARTFLGQGVNETSGGTAGSDGGYLVPQGFMAELVKSLKAWGPMLDPGVTRILPTASGNALPWPTMDDTSNKGALISENTQVTLSELQFGSKTLGAWKYGSGVVLVSSELLQDSGIDVEGIVNAAMAERISRAGNTDLTVGDGSSKPSGIAHAASSGVTAAATGTVTFDEVISLEHAVDPAYRSDPSCRFMFNDAMLKILRQLKDGQQRYIWQPADVKTGAPGTILGHPYSINQDMPAVSTGNKTILFGAFNRYVVRLVNNFTIRRLVERYADFDQTGFLGFSRLDGQLLDAGAVKALTQA